MGVSAGGSLAWLPLGCRCVRGVAAKKNQWEELEQETTIGVVWGRDYDTHSSHFPVVSRAGGRYLMGMCLDWQGRNFFFNISIQSAVKRGVAEADSKPKDMRVSNLSS